MKNNNILKNRYIGKDNIPRVKNSLVAFIDILGYEYLVNLQSSKVKDNSLFYKIRKLVNKCIALTDTRYGYDNKYVYRSMEYKVFSDNILIGMPIVDDFYYGYQLEELIHMVGLMQMIFAHNGVFIRGAITEGGISIDDKMAYGKGLIKAYKLEKEIAIYPRIIIDPKIKDDNKTLFECYKRGKLKYILLDSDGILFVNHMETLLPVSSARKGLGVKFLNNSLKGQKNNIEFLLEYFKHNANVRSKYIWAANYYNYFCSQHAELGKHIIDMDKNLCKISDNYS